MKWLAAGVILASVAGGATSCSEGKADQSCAQGKGHWIEDDSGSIGSTGYKIVVRICVDDGGNVLDMEVD
jgi:hypothetical protein